MWVQGQLSDQQQELVCPLVERMDSLVVFTQGQVVTGFMVRVGQNRIYAIYDCTFE